MYRHWTEARWEEDDQAALEAECVLVRIRAEAAKRVPEWSPELREEFRRTHPRHVHT